MPAPNLMPFEKGMHPGTTWHKCDFQCHTPRDRQWDGATRLPGGTTAREQAREKWAIAFLDACKAANLSAVAITDHHDICIAKYVAEAERKFEYGIKVFSGTEITCSDNAQCLAIFDPSLDYELQRSILILAGDVRNAPVDDHYTCMVAPAREDITYLFDAVAKEQKLSEGTVLIPHFSVQEAHKNLNETGHHPRFAKLPCDGIYIERQYVALDPTTIGKVRGKVPEWGSRRRAILATGDNRSETWMRLGAHHCWIKLGEHSVEAIRQAFLADEARISFVEPRQPSELVRSLTVKSTLTGDKPVMITFNEGLTTLIGGRGSGKTTLLEYLRFGLGRATHDIEPDRGNKKDEDGEPDLFKETLAGDGFVEVVLEREGVTETWRRTHLARTAIICTSQDGQNIELSSLDARDRFRGRAFSQKGLSTTMMDMEKAAEYITSIAAAEELNQRRRVDLDLLGAKRTTTTRLQQLAAYWQTSTEREQAEQRITDFRTRIQSIADKLAAEGVSDLHLKTIEDQPRHSRAASYIEQVSAASQRDKERVNQLSTNRTPRRTAGFGGFPVIRSCCSRGER